MNPRSSAIPAAAVLTIAGLLAYTTEITKAWILSPVGDWFGDLVPDQKVIVIAALVVAVSGIITWRRARRRNSVARSNAAITAALGTSQ